MIGWFVFGGLLTLATLVSPVPAWLNRLFLVPRGHVRAAYRVGLVSLRGWRLDQRGAALVEGARAAFVLGDERRRAAVAWLEQRSRRMHSFRGGGLVGCGLLAALRGDRESARLLLHGVERLETEHCPVRAYELAREWLAADAARDGRWEAVVLIASRAPHRTLATSFIGLVGARLLGDRVYASDGALRRAWQLAPHRRSLRPLLERALTSTRPRQPLRPSAPPSASRPSDRLAFVSERYFELRGRDDLDEGALRELACAWEAELADEARTTWARERARLLGLQVRDPMPALTRSVEEALAELIESGGVPIGRLVEADGMLGRLARARRSMLLGEIELHLARLRRQLDDASALDPLDGMRTFFSLADTYESRVRGAGLEVRRSAFASIHEVVARFADWLDSGRGERAFAGALRRWSIEESRIAGGARNSAPPPVPVER